MPQFAKLLVALIVISFTTNAASQELSLMSYNIRLDIQSDGENRWDNRKQQLAAQIAFHAPDVFGIQEGLPQQVDYLAQALPGYAFTGVGRDDGKRSGEHSALFYRKATVELLESNTFWLSETPDTPSFGWGASHRRICTYARFRDIGSGQTYWIFNTHFDHEVETARLEGSKLILAHIDTLVSHNEAYFLMGDLNATPEQAPIRMISEHLRDTLLASPQPPFGPEGTFNGFDTTTPPNRRIDYIFASPDHAEILAYACLSPLVDQRYLSDHFPVVAHVRLSN